MSALASPMLAGPSSRSPTANNNNLNTRVTLTPTAGFCVKSATTEAGSYVFAASASTSASSAEQTQTTKSAAAGGSKKDASAAHLLEPAAAPRRLQIPKGTKVFLNIAWAAYVPPPPPAVDEAAVRRAMMGADLDDGEGEGAYYVPVVVSEPREDTDKAGKPCVVFDAVFNSSLKSRCTKDPEFKLYIIELALEHVEEKTNVLLSRQIGTPNIASKGKLGPRTVLVPSALLDGSSPIASAGKATVISESKPSMLQEQEEVAGVQKSASASISSTTTRKKKASAETAPPPKSILKSAVPATPAATARSPSASVSAPASNAKATAETKRPLIEELPSSSAGTPDNAPPLDFDLGAADFLPVPRWSWTRDSESKGERLRIDIEVPNLTRALHSLSALDVEARRILLYVPKTYFLDINLDLSDAQIGKLRSMSLESSPSPPRGEEKEKRDPDGVDVDELRTRGHNAGEALRLKRQRDLDVANARAEWRIGERRVVIWA